MVSRKANPAGVNTARAVVAALALVCVLGLAVKALLTDITVSIPSEKPYVPAEIVCATPSGARYHREDCSSIADSKELTAMKPEEAAAQGLTPCQLCKP